MLWWEAYSKSPEKSMVPLKWECFNNSRKSLIDDKEDQINRKKTHKTKKFKGSPIFYSKWKT